LTAWLKPIAINGFKHHQPQQERQYLVGYCKYDSELVKYSEQWNK
jgi:hypothetical protein